MNIEEKLRNSLVRVACSILFSLILNNPQHNLINHHQVHIINKGRQVSLINQILLNAIVILP